MGWLPSAPQLERNPLRIAAEAEAAGMPVPHYVASARCKAGTLRDVLRGSRPSGELAAQHVRLAVEPARLLGQGARVFPQAPARHASTACRARTSASRAGAKPEEVAWHDEAPKGKLDLLVTLDFRMSTTCMYSDIVLPTATWYEKHDLNTSDMHPFIHPLSAAVDPAWESAHRLGDLQGHRQALLAMSQRPSGRREGRGADAADA